MTRKDYQLIAEAVRDSKPRQTNNPDHGAQIEQWQRTAGHIGYALAADNPRFDRDRFSRACGIE